ncbi:hypothetical protein D3C87_1751140 [compost metagenome]
MGGYGIGNQALLKGCDLVGQTAAARSGRGDLIRRRIEPEHQPFGSIAQLAHIARPVALRHLRQQVLRDLDFVPAVTRCGFPHELQEQQRDVGTALRQRRHA